MRKAPKIGWVTSGLVLGLGAVQRCGVDSQLPMQGVQMYRFPAGLDPCKGKATLC